MKKKIIVVLYVENTLLDFPNTKIAKVEKNQETKENKLKPLHSLNVQENSITT
jgi:hypothetical protein